jgi:hypothetical protein
VGLWAIILNSKIKCFLNLFCQYNKSHFFAHMKA